MRQCFVPPQCLRASSACIKPASEAMQAWPTSVLGRFALSQRGCVSTLALSPEHGVSRRCRQPGWAGVARVGCGVPSVRRWRPRLACMRACRRVVPRPEKGLYDNRIDQPVFQHLEQGGGVVVDNAARGNCGALAMFQSVGRPLRPDLVAPVRRALGRYVRMMLDDRALQRLAEIHLSTVDKVLAHIDEVLVQEGMWFDDLTWALLALALSVRWAVVWV